MNVDRVRWLTRRDMPDVLRIETASFEYPWCDGDFLCCLRQRNCIGMVAERDYQVVGFMIYELCKGKLQILNFAVHPACRRQRIGWAIAVTEAVRAYSEALRALVPEREQWRPDQKGGEA